MTVKSSCEVEYQTLSNCACEGLWLHGLLDDIGIGFVGPTILKCDNQNAIKLTNNLVFQEKPKHFEKDGHFACQQVE
jgi:hypothetical protein